MPQLDSFLNNCLSIKSWIQMFYSRAKRSETERPGTKQIALDSCLADLVTTLVSSSRDLPGSFSQVVPLIEDFGRDITTMVNTWDRHLRQSTRVLWDEIGVFSASRFLDGPRKAQVVSMAPTMVPNPAITSSPLCKISRTATNGETTGVLSVWPSSLFESQRAQRLSVDEFRGWVARYELWYHKDGCSKLADVSIPLDPHAILSNQTKPVNGNAITFPLSISHDTRSFTVLQKLFSARAAVKDGRRPLESTDISISFEVPDDEENDTSSPGGYSFFLSPDDRYLVFAHWKKIAMFEIQREPILNVTGVAAQVIWSLEWSPITNVIFHPSASIAILQAGGWIAAWAFLYTKPDVAESRGWLGWLFNSSDDIQDLTLSACGKYVVFEPSSHDAPVIKPVPKSMLPRESPKHKRPPTLRTQDTSVSLPGASGTTALSTIQLMPGQAIQPTQAPSKPGQAPSHIVTVSGGTEVAVQRTEVNSTHASDILTIISLPKCSAVENSTPTILAPGAGDAAIRIVMNTNGQGTYDKDTLLDVESPFFISRNVSMVQHIVWGQPDLADVGMEATGVQSGTTHSVLNEGAGKERASKKRRI